MKYTTLSIVIAAGIGLSLPAQAAKPVWPDTLVQLHGAGNAYLTDTVIATLETCKGGTLRGTPRQRRCARGSRAG